MHQQGWDGGRQAGGEVAPVGAGTELGRRGAAGEEGKGGLAGTAACGGVCAEGHREGVSWIPPVKRDGSASGGSQSRQRGGGGKAPARPGQLAPAQATFLSFPKPISLEVLLKPGSFLRVALALILSGMTPSSLPMQQGRSPSRPPRAPETPIPCPRESKPSRATSRGGPRTGQERAARKRSLCRGEPRTHRGVLALDAGTVEAQGSDAGGAARDVEDALVVALAGLRLGQVLGRQGDGFHHSHGDVDLGGGQDLGAVLQGEQGAADEKGTPRSLPQHPRDPTGQQAGQRVAKIPP